MAKKAKDDLATFAGKAGISISYASQLENKRRIPTPDRAVDIYQRTGRRYGLMKATKTPEEDAALVRVFRRAKLIPAKLPEGVLYFQG